MVSTTLARVQQNLKTANVSANMFARIARSPVSTVTASFRGTHYAGSEEEARWLSLSVRLAALVEAAKPFECPKGNAEVLTALLESTPEKVRESVSTIFGREGE
jgi:hypothetical protein